MSIKYKTVRIRWIDAHTLFGWSTIAMTDYPPIFIDSIGYLIKEDKKTMTITTSISSNGAAADALTILKSSIVKKRIINPNG